MDKVRLAIFASGGGSNARVIMEYFQNHPCIAISLVLYSKKEAGVKTYAGQFGIESVYWPDRWLKEKETTMSLLNQLSIQGIILAGYLSLIPDYLINTFPDRILNIHPSLLPSFGGKGMYGHFVHEAVSRSGHVESGITIHVVNNEYDKGKIIFQEAIPIIPFEDPINIAKKVLKLEHKYYSTVIEQYFTPEKP